MKRLLICTTLLPLSVLAQDYVPRDVQRLIDLRAGCEASREVRGSCSANGKELAQLKEKYAANSTILQILNQFDVGTGTADTVETPLPASAPKKRKVKRAG